MKRPKIPATLWGVFVVTADGCSTYSAWFTSRKKAREHADLFLRHHHMPRSLSVRYVVRKFTDMGAT